MPDEQKVRSNAHSPCEGAAIHHCPMPSLSTCLSAGLSIRRLPLSCCSLYDQSIKTSSGFGEGSYQASNRCLESIRL